jgi:hypothetical protein
MMRAFATLTLAALWCAGSVWGYHHAVELRIERRDAQAQAVVRAKDMQQLDDFRALRRCQSRVEMEYLHEQTAIMVAHSALKLAGMER